MTPTDLDDALDAREAAASADANARPGLITIQTDDWVGPLDTVRAICKSLADGMRHRNIVIHVGSQQTTAVLTRAEAGRRGAPYLDLGPRT